ncbi:MAG: hypothetical protein JXQ87_11895 [Bacteroidia bacterium]
MSFLKDLFKRRPILDPSIFKDDKAFQIDWEPLKRGGTNFKTHKLVFDESGDARFIPTSGIYLSSVLILLGAIVASVIFYSKNIFDASLFPLVVVLVMVGFSVYSLVVNLKPRVFSPMNGIYYKGKRPKGGDTVSDKNYALLADIYALQIIRERVSSGKSSFTSYELNLVLKNGDRLNVVDHGKLKSIREESKQLADFLQVPVWDASQYRT